MATQQKTRVLVTGASAGIGFALVKRFAAQENVVVFGCARNIESLQNVDCAGKESIRPVVCDVSDEVQVKAMFEEINKTSGGLDVCVNNAGMALDDSLLHGSPDSWRRIYEVNVIGLCMVTQNAVKSMILGGGDDCKILNVNSVLGHHGVTLSRPSRSFYASTKMAVTGITSALRAEISLEGLADKIKVMQVSPGLTETELAYRSSGAEGGAASYKNPSLRPLQVDDVVDCIMHALAAPKYAVVTDQILWNCDFLRHTPAPKIGDK